MKKNKFKVGDRVKITSSCFKGLVGRYATVCYQCFDYILNTNVYKLKDFSICKELSAIFIKFKEDELEFASDKKIEKVYKEQETVAMPIKQEKTIISHKIEGNKTIVTLSDGSVGVSRCHPEDKFDAYIGLKLAMERAYGVKTNNEETKPKPKFEVGKKYILDGTIYKGTIIEITSLEIKNGRLYYLIKIVKEANENRHLVASCFEEGTLLANSLKLYSEVDEGYIATRNLSNKTNHCSTPIEPEVKEVNRRAKAGEYIKLTRDCYSFSKKGDILRVGEVGCGYVTVSVDQLTRMPLEHHTTFPDKTNWAYSSDSYVVLENYKPQKADKKCDTTTKAKFEIGKRYILNNIAYKGTILEITSIVRITNAPHRPIIRYGVKIIHKAHDFRPIDFFEEGSLLAIALKPYEEPQVKEVKRPAKVGEYIKNIRTGEICEVIAISTYRSSSIYVRSKKDCGYEGDYADREIKPPYDYLMYIEYVVLEGYEPDPFKRYFSNSYKK